jgi:hypothetical protein
VTVDCCAAKHLAAAPQRLIEQYWRCFECYYVRFAVVAAAGLRLGGGFSLTRQIDGDHHQFGQMN